jgi:hypothetical protein
MMVSMRSGFGTAIRAAVVIGLLLATSAAWAWTHGAPGPYIELENGTGAILLENGTGAILLEH